MTHGTITDPLTLADALASDFIRPGHTVYLRGGVYHGPFRSALNGTADQPITFRPYQDEHPIIDGGLIISGAWQTWQDMEIMYSGWTTRYSDIPGSNVPGPFGWAQFSAYGKGAILRRCVMHDLCNVDWGVGASESVWEDCLIYNIGWDASDRSHGHGAYIQNDATGPKTMRRCVSLLAYATPCKVYGIAAPLQDVHVEDCVFAYAKEGYTYVRSDGGVATAISVRNLLTYGIQWDHSCFASGGGPLAVDGGVIVTDADSFAYTVNNWQRGAHVRNLQIVGHRLLSEWIATMPSGWIDQSAYTSLPPVAQDAPFATYAPNAGIIYHNLREWQAGTGNDASGTYGTSLPAAPRIDVITRTQDRVVVVYNWQDAASVPAPFAGRYTNALNPAESLDVTDTLPMDIWSTALPIGASAPVAAFDPRFGCFLVTP